MDRYLYPRSYINPAFINALAPPDGLPRAHKADDAIRSRILDIRDAGTEANDSAMPEQAQKTLHELAELDGRVSRVDAA
jgi:hypothetical protein